jgi:catechol 2,3-dioxygenase-like lactoylglutathione lyase family enzyme
VHRLGKAARSKGLREFESLPLRQKNMNSIAHLEVNVSNLEKSKEFYCRILSVLKWEVNLDDNIIVGFKGPDQTHLFLVQTEPQFSSAFHRKNIGLNHVAFRTHSKDEVDSFSIFLKENNLTILYGDGPKDYSSEYKMEEYYAVFFEDPDRIKLEVVFMK